MPLNTWDTARYQCLWNLNEEEQEQRETNNKTEKVGKRQACTEYVYIML